MELALYNARQKIQNLTTQNPYEYNNIVDRMMINLFNKDIGAYDKARSECVEKNIDPGVIDKASVLVAAVKPGKGAMKLPDKKTLELYSFLKARYPNVKRLDLVKCALRYAALGMGGQQWRLDTAILEKIYKLGITTEAFASPFNHYFKRYYSIFDDDAAFGSLGSFFNKAHAPGEALYINPPFTPHILSRMAESVCKLDRAVIITPSWSDADWYKKLESCGFSKQLKTGTKYNMLEKEFVPKFTTTMWTKGVLVAL